MDMKDYAQGWYSLMRDQVAMDPACEGDPTAKGYPPTLSEWREDRYMTEKSWGILGAMIQLGMEDPEEFNRMFGPVLFEKFHPCKLSGLVFIGHALGNGVQDDWEIFLQWRDEGYVLVNEDERRDQDARFREEVASSIMPRACRGIRMAPGESDVDALWASLYTRTP